MITAGYFFLYLVRYSIPTLSGTALALISMSAGTGLVSIVIDGSKRQQSIDRRNQLLGERAKVVTTVGASVATADQANELRRIDEELDQINQGLNASESKGFLIDILSNADGPTIYRLQAVVWTIVLGVIFVVQTYRELSMPEFSATLLGLMGISSGTYLGFKLPDPPASTKASA